MSEEHLNQQIIDSINLMKSHEWLEWLEAMDLHKAHLQEQVNNAVDKRNWENAIEERGKMRDLERQIRAFKKRLEMLKKENNNG